VALAKIRSDWAHQIAICNATAREQIPHVGARQLSGLRPEPLLELPATGPIAQQLVLL